MLIYVYAHVHLHIHTHDANLIMEVSQIYNNFLTQKNIFTHHPILPQQLPPRRLPDQSSSGVGPFMDQTDLRREGLKP